MNPRLLSFEKEMASWERLYGERTQRVTALDQELSELAKEASLLEKVEMVLQLVSTKVLGQSTATIDQLVTAGLRTVFHDQDLTFKTTVDKFRGKTAIHFELYEEGRTVPLTEGYGGGVLVVIGVLLRVVTIILLKQRRFLLLDESLSHLSEQYIPNASKLLNKLAKELHFDILMVSHQPEFAKNATRHYEAKRTKSGTVFDLVSNP